MYVAAYRRRRASGKETPEVTRTRKEFAEWSQALAWLEERIKTDPRAEIGCLRKGRKVVRIVYAG